MEIFTEEYQEETEKIYDSLQRLKDDTSNQQILEDIRRSYHTLKGSGRIMGALALGDYAWAYESVLNEFLSNRSLTVSTPLINLLERSSQALQSNQQRFLAENALNKPLQQQVELAEQWLADPEAMEKATEIMLDDSHTELVSDSDTIELPDVTETKEESQSIDGCVDHIEDNNQTEEKHLLETASVNQEHQYNNVKDSKKIANKKNVSSQKSKKTTSDSSEVVLQLFQEDLPELLEAIDGTTLAIHQEPDNLQNITDLERHLHTLKGGARMIGAKELADISHDVETLLNDIVTGFKAMDKLALNHLLTAVDKIQDLSEAVLLDQNIKISSPSIEDQSTQIETIKFDVAKPKENYSSLLEQVLSEQKDSLPEIILTDSQAGVNQAAVPEALSASRGTIRLPAKAIDNMVNISTEININQTRLTDHLQHFGSDIDELMMTATRLHQQLRELELETEVQIRHSYELEHGKQIEQEEFDPLEMDQYSEIQQLSRFIREGLNDLGSIEKNLSAEQTRIKQVLKQQSQISREMQQELLAIRLTEVSIIWPRLKRIARQTATDLGKDIEINMYGEHCELDRVVLQRITAPLEHMIRNAIFHGIELPEERLKANKPEKGKLQFRIEREGAEILIRLSDDGQGINEAAVYQKALEMGLVSEADKLSTEEKHRLIFHAGLSTSELLSQISGRGVGMDVVSSEIKKMGGNLQLKSNSNGTEFTIRLPLTLATNQVLLVEIANQQYAVPMSGIVALQRISNKELQEAFADESPQLSYNNQSYCLQHLAHALKQPIRFDEKPNDKSPVLFINIDKQRVVYRLDKIMGNQEVVIKPLSRMLHGSRLYSAATIQADGRVILILNTSELVHRKIERVLAQKKEESTDNQVSSVENPNQASVMVVDDSITIRKVTEKLLKSHDYHVVTAKDGMHALEKLNENIPDIMLLDIEMPRMDGFELLSSLRNSKQWKSLPVIMISSRTGQKHRKRAEQLGVMKFMGKPYQEEKLLMSIESLLDRVSESA